MKGRTVLFSLFAVSMLLVTAAYAEEAMEQKVMAAAETVAVEASQAAQEVAAVAEETAEVAESMDMGNKICPISGEKVDDHGEPFKQEYKGKTYNLCCAMCAADFQKDPEGFIKKMEDSMKAEMKEEAAEVVKEVTPETK